MPDLLILVLCLVFARFPLFAFVGTWKLGTGISISNGMGIHMQYERPQVRRELNSDFCPASVTVGKWKNVPFFPGNLPRLKYEWLARDCLRTSIHTFHIFTCLLGLAMIERVVLFGT